MSAAPSASSMPPGHLRRSPKAYDYCSAPRRPMRSENHPHSELATKARRLAIAIGIAISAGLLSTPIIRAHCGALAGECSRRSRCRDEDEVSADPLSNWNSWQGFYEGTYGPPGSPDTGISSLAAGALMNQVAAAQDIT